MKWNVGFNKDKNDYSLVCVCYWFLDENEIWRLCICLSNLAYFFPIEVQHIPDVTEVARKTHYPYLYRLGLFRS